ncbi:MULTISPECIES: HAD-IA family hydrolase [Thermus]|jgi:HAD superfamily hydrolase (TIGR01509 family)|uniref:Haloacid dehalogenase superfamily protein, subfamily IA, variant 3 with third motif having DD or ED n=1 Tax=Thermus oshimai JL-2 TaxID=751945 RepID=K7RK53_THEOS|nr:HAD-IA family hydrolase [Thermus oshimai]AFV76762.1 haloacid dehalogenase superfamily protein, subfamily IA, variant 3 with third motif having DD or ED [Thermus oshimai JL-2]
MVGVKALLLDLDGTLAETEELHREAFNRAFREAGLPFSWDRPLYKALLEVTGGKERIAHFLRSFPDAPRLSEEALTRLHQRKNALYEALLREEGAPLRPGVRRLLGEAREAGLLLALVTTTSPENARAFLETSGLKGVFHLVLAGDIVPHKKPDPAIYHLARKELGLGEGEGVAVEDSRNGLLSARGAGFPVLITPGLYTADQDFSEAQGVAEHLGEPGHPARFLQGPRAGERGVVDLDYLEEVRGWWST